MLPVSEETQSSKITKDTLAFDFSEKFEELENEFNQVRLVVYSTSYTIPLVSVEIALTYSYCSFYFAEVVIAVS